MVSETMEDEELRWEAYEKLLGQTSEDKGYEFHSNVGELVDTLQRYEDTYPDDVNDKVLRWHNDIGYLTGSTLSNLRRYVDGNIDLQTFNEYMATTLDNIAMTPDSVLLAVQESNSLQETVHHTMFVLEMLKKQPPTLLYDCKRKSFDKIEEEEEERKKTMSGVIGRQLKELQAEARTEETKRKEEIREETDKEREEFKQEYKREKKVEPSRETSWLEAEGERELEIWRRENKSKYSGLEPRGNTIPDAMDYIMTFLENVGLPAPVKALKGDMIVKGFKVDEVERALDNLLMDNKIRMGEMLPLGEVIAPYRETRRDRPPKREEEERDVRDVDFEEVELPEREEPKSLPEAEGFTIDGTFLREVDEGVYEFETDKGKFRVKDLGEFGFRLERIA